MLTEGAHDLGYFLGRTGAQDGPDQVGTSFVDLPHAQRNLTAAHAGDQHDASLGSENGETCRDIRAADQVKHDIESVEAALCFGEIAELTEPVVEHAPGFETKLFGSFD